MIKQLVFDNITIPYRPYFRKITGSTNAAILLQQVLFHWDGSGYKPFYKFFEPCKNAFYKKGTSWTEELAFSLDEFRGALALIGTRIRYADLNKELLKTDKTNIILYWKDSSLVTYWVINEKALDKALKDFFTSEATTGTHGHASNQIADDYRYKEATGQPTLFNPSEPVKAEIKVAAKEEAVEVTSRNVTKPKPRGRKAFVSTLNPAWSSEEDARAAFDQWLALYEHKANWKKAWEYFRYDITPELMPKLLACTTNYVLQTVASSSKANLYRVRQRRDPQGFLNPENRFWEGWDTKPSEEETVAFAIANHGSRKNLTERQAAIYAENYRQLAERKDRLENRTQGSERAITRRREQALISAGNDLGDIPKLPGSPTANRTGFGTNDLFLGQNATADTNRLFDYLLGQGKGK